MPKLARRLVQPDYDTGPEWVETYGPEVCEVNAAAGFAPDPQQEHALNKIFGIRADGLPSCFAYGCVVCRQNLKTGLFKQTAVGWTVVTEESWFVWSAHEMATTREAQSEIHELFASTPVLSRYLPGTRNGGLYTDNGEERIEFTTGQRIMFRARGTSGGRGLAAPKVILDEAFALRASHVGSLIPTMMAQPAGQVLYGSSAGKIDSEVLRDVRDRGRSGASPRLAYDEWFAPREKCGEPDCKHPKDAVAQGLDCALDRVHLRVKANPTLTTGRITLERIEDMRQELPPEEFARECLGWWDEVANKADLVLPGWSSIGDVDLVPPSTPAAIGLAVSYDREFGSIGAAGILDDGRHYLAAVRRDPATWWMVEEAARIQRDTGCLVAIDGGGPAATLIPALIAAGVRLEIANTGDMCDAAAGLQDAVKDKLVAHGFTDELDDAVAVTVKRIVVDRWTLGRRASGDDISMCEGVMLARWAATTAEPADVSIYSFESLDLCDRCGVEPHEDPDGEHDYLCPDCRAEEAPDGQG
jgi:hypothetical protein